MNHFVYKQCVCIRIEEWAITEQLHGTEAVEQIIGESELAVPPYRAYDPEVTLCDSEFLREIVYKNCLKGYSRAI